MTKQRRHRPNIGAIHQQACSERGAEQMELAPALFLDALLKKVRFPASLFFLCAGMTVPRSHRGLLRR
jgi:hypothetical protein